jgi:hypothetical protein
MLTSMTCSFLAIGSSQNGRRTGSKDRSWRPFAPKKGGCGIQGLFLATVHSQKRRLRDPRIVLGDRSLPKKAVAGSKNRSWRPFTPKMRGDGLQGSFLATVHSQKGGRRDPRIVLGDRSLQKRGSTGSKDCSWRP